MRDFEGLACSWTSEYTYLDDKSDSCTTTVKKKVEIVNKGDSMELKFTNDKGMSRTSLRIYNEGKNLGYGPFEYDIVAVRRLGDRLIIIADREGTGSNKGLIIRQTFTIWPGILNITRETEKEGTDRFYADSWDKLKKQGIKH